jgi:phage tail tube protein FII
MGIVSFKHRLLYRNVTDRGIHRTEGGMNAWVDLDAGKEENPFSRSLEDQRRYILRKFAGYFSRKRKMPEISFTTKMSYRATHLTF